MHNGTNVLNPGKKPGNTFSEDAEESLHKPPPDVTFNFTWYVPAPLNVCTGVESVEVFNMPVDGSPKSHEKIVPDGFATLLLNFCVKPSHVVDGNFNKAFSGV